MELANVEPVKDKATSFIEEEELRAKLALVQRVDDLGDLPYGSRPYCMQMTLNRIAALRGGNGNHFNEQPNSY